VFHLVYLALGSNLGDRLANLQAGLEALSSRVVTRATSPVYETPPWGYLDQPPFLNQVVLGETELKPVELLAFLKHVEVKQGRRRTFKNGPRKIDLDILFYDDLVMQVPSLTIPHPRMIGRAFVLIPLADIAPDLVHPVLLRKVKDLAAEVDATGVVRYQRT
jgi:2-amino-4-hydroxy-6-hydroxymethyldihydropteridine diphosphokinase